MTCSPSHVLHREAQLHVSTCSSSFAFCHRLCPLPPACHAPPAKSGYEKCPLLAKPVLDDEPGYCAIEQSPIVRYQGRARLDRRRGDV